MGALQSLVSQTSSTADSPSVSISLPPNIPSETVQIAYHLVGPFGGRGGYIKQGEGLHSYEIASSVEGTVPTGPERHAFRANRAERAGPRQKCRANSLLLGFLVSRVLRHR